MTSALRWASDESHFNVSVGSDGQSHRTVSTNHNLFEEKGKPKRYRTEVLPLTNLNALPPGQTGSCVTLDSVVFLYTAGAAERLRDTSGHPAPPFPETN